MTSNLATSLVSCRRSDGMPVLYNDNGSKVHQTWKIDGKYGNRLSPHGIFPLFSLKYFFSPEKSNKKQPETFTLGNNRNEIARTLEYRIKSSQFYEICKCLFVPTDAVFEIIKLPANGAVNFSLHFVVERRITSFI